MQDLVSYNKEQASGDDQHNIITIVMDQLHTNVEGAMEWVYNHHRKLEVKFFDMMKTLPSFGHEVDTQVREYLLGLGNWPRANDCWGFESGRYFGNRGQEIQSTRLVPLQPKVDKDPLLKGEKVVITLGVV